MKNLFKDIVKTIDEGMKEKLKPDALMSKRDEGLPSESGKYKDMSLEEIIKLALSMENDAIEINLALIEKSNNLDDKAKFVEIANDENDHSLIYQSILREFEVDVNE